LAKGLECVVGEQGESPNFKGLQGMRLKEIPDLNEEIAPD